MDGSSSTQTSASYSSISDTDQYFKLTVGRYGSYRFEAFARDLPNARIMQGVAQNIDPDTAAALGAYLEKTESDQ